MRLAKLCRLCGIKVRWWQKFSAYRDNGHIYHGSCWTAAIITVNLFRQNRLLTGQQDKRYEQRFDTLENSLAIATNVIHNDLQKHTERIESFIIMSDKDQYAYNRLTLEETRKILMWLDKHGAKRDDKEYIAMFDPMLVEIILKTTGMSLKDLAAQIKNKELKRVINSLMKKEENTHES